jgi:hypothetical protein
MAEPQIIRRGHYERGIDARRERAPLRYSNA